MSRAMQLALVLSIVCLIQVADGAYLRSLQYEQSNYAGYGFYGYPASFGNPGGYGGYGGNGFGSYPYGGGILTTLIRLLF